MTPVVSVENLSKHYGRRRAVDDVSFTVDRGEVLGLLGPNGSGKTTILRILTGYLHASAGRVRVAGFDVVEEGIEARRRIGYVPEDAPLYASMRVGETLDFMGRLRGLSGCGLSAAVNDAIERLSLGAVRSLAVGKLSRGYRQRVAIAQALLNGPDLLVLDEPTNGLDPRQIIELRQLVVELSQQHTLLVTSHILAEMERVATRVAILLEGRLLAVKSLAGEGSCCVRVRLRDPDPETAVSALRAVDGVVRVKQQPGPREGVFQCLVEMTTEQVAERLPPALVSGGFRLVEMSDVAVELESLFLSLTEQARP